MLTMAATEVMTEMFAVLVAAALSGRLSLPVPQDRGAEASHEKADARESKSRITPNPQSAEIPHTAWQPRVADQFAQTWQAISLFHYACSTS